MVKVQPINLKIHAAWMLTLALCGAFSLAKVNSTFSLWQARKESGIAHSDRITEIEQQAAIQQAEIDNHINTYDSVTVTGYVCDPQTPPEFDPTPFAKPDELVRVADQYQRVIGYIDVSGRFTFHAGNCDTPLQ